MTDVTEDGDPWNPSYSIPVINQYLSGDFILTSGQLSCDTISSTQLLIDTISFSNGMSTMSVDENTFSLTAQDFQCQNLISFGNTTLGDNIYSDNVLVNAISTFNGNAIFQERMYGYGLIQFGQSTAGTMLTVYGDTILDGTLDLSSTNVTWPATPPWSSALYSAPSNMVTTDTTQTITSSKQFDAGIDVRTQTTGTTIATFRKAGAARFSLIDEGGVAGITSAVLQNPTANGIAIQASNATGTVDLYQQTTKRLSATSSGVTIVGTLNCDAISCTSTTNSGNLTIQGNTTIGDAATDTLTVNAASTFNKFITLPSSVSASPAVGQLGYVATPSYTPNNDPITSGALKNWGSVVLTPGIWLLAGAGALFTSTATSVAWSHMRLCWSPTSITFDWNNMMTEALNVTTSQNHTYIFNAPTSVVTVTANTTYYLVGYPVFSTGTLVVRSDLGTRITAVRIA